MPSTIRNPIQIRQGWGSLNTTMVDFDGDSNQDLNHDLLAQSSEAAMRRYRSDGAGVLISETHAVIGPAGES